MKHKICKRIWVSLISVICAASLLMTGASAGTLGVSGQTQGLTDEVNQPQSSSEMMAAIGSMLAESYINKQAAVTVTAEPSDELISRLEAAVGVDCSWIDSVALELNGGLSGLRSNLSAGLLLNGYLLLTVEYILDYSAGLMYMRFPELSETYVRVDLNDAFREVYGMNSVNYDTLMEGLTSMMVLAAMVGGDNADAQMRSKTLAAASRLLAAIAENPIVVTRDSLKALENFSLSSQEPVEYGSPQPETSEEPAEQGSGEQNDAASEEIDADEEEFSLRVLSLNADEAALSGELSLRIGELLTEMLFMEAGLPSLTESIDVLIGFDSTNESTESVCDLMDGSELLLRLSVSSLTGGTAFIPATVDSCDMEEWSNLIMENGGLESFLERLYGSDIPEELLNAMFYVSSGEMPGI